LIAFLAAREARDPWFRFALERQVEWMALRAVAEARPADPWWDFRRGFADNAVTETGPSLVARALHSYRHQLEAAKAKATGRNATTGPAFGGGSGGGGGADDVFAMTYDAFAKSWGEHHGSCSWCGGEGKKSKKFSGASRCVDVQAGPCAGGLKRTFEGHACPP
jgi:hypothetical protein